MKFKAHFIFALLITVAFLVVISAPAQHQPHTGINSPSKPINKKKKKKTVSRRQSRKAPLAHNGTHKNRSAHRSSKMASRGHAARHPRSMTHAHSNAQQSDSTQNLGKQLSDGKAAQQTPQHQH